MVKLTLNCESLMESVPEHFHRRQQRPWDLRRQNQILQLPTPSLHLRKHLRGTNSNNIFNKNYKLQVVFNDSFRLHRFTFTNTCVGQIQLTFLVNLQIVNNEIFLLPRLIMNTYVEQIK